MLKTLLRIVSVLLALSYVGQSTPSQAADGLWREKAQVVWSKKTRTLVRQTFRVWDPHPDLDLDFLWEPRSPATASDGGFASGLGTLTWHTKGAANYDRRFTYSVFKGTLRNGRAHGQGVLAVRTGLSYTGEWADGLMHGRGILRLENGDKYEGDFVAGKMHGVGKYSATDGLVYFGEFRAGLRDGIGRLMLADGSYRTAWQAGSEIERQRISDSTAEQTATRPRAAALSDAVTLKLSLDQKKAAEFELADPDTETHSYEAEHTPGLMTIRLASRALREAWKGNGPIPTGTTDKVDPKFIMDSWQFAPVFLKARVENAGAKAVRITNAYLDVAESATDLAPYLELHRGDNNFCQEDESYNPVLNFQNFGWGNIRRARLTYSLGVGAKQTERTVVNLGDFDAAKKTSIADRLRRLGVNVERLRRAGDEFRATSRLNQEQLDRYAFRCERGEQSDDPDDFQKAFEPCFANVKNSGALGQMKDFVGLSGNIVYTIASGTLEYQWTDSNRKSNSRTSSFSLFVPLIKFNVDMGEMGCNEPEMRASDASNLLLDRRKYRIALAKSWQTEVPQSGATTFDLAVTAPKSSHHNFQLVLELSDGSQAASPVIDLSYFRPRVPRPKRQ